MAKKILYYFLVFIGFLSLLITLLSLIYDITYWYIKVLDFPRLQILLVSAVGLLVLMLLKIKWTTLRKIVVVCFLAAILIQAYFIFPYTPLAAVAVEEGNPENTDATVELIVANVWMKNDNAADFLNIVSKEEPDMVLVMEVNQWWLDQLDTLQNLYPFIIEYPLDNTYGMALYSKLPLKKQKILFLNDKDVPSFHAQVQLPSNKIFNFHAVHPVPPKPSNYPDNIGEKEISLIKVGRMIAGENEPSVVAGDFNDVAWSNTSRLFETTGQLNDVRIGRGLYNSFDAKSWIMRWPIDHIYVTEEFRLLNLERLPKFGSDHFPILVELTL